MAISPARLTQTLKSEAQRLGFGLCGACRAVTPVGYAHFLEWLEAGFAGEMVWLQDRKSAYEHPDGVLPGTVSLLMLGMNYNSVARSPSTAGTGKVSRYAWGSGDYHDLIQVRLKSFKEFAETVLRESGIERPQVRGVIDTAPLLEREFAQLAGLGWKGKNTMLINRKQGSWFFIAALLMNVELEYDEPFQANHCGTCTACLDACPTDAFPQAGVLDATKCISYLTIEHRSQIPMELRSRMGDWILGCDICQDVCPWNRKAPSSMEPVFLPAGDQNPIALRELFSLTEETFRTRFRKTPLWRPKRRGLLRNAAIALGNRPNGANLQPLTLGLNDVEPLVRGASAWALGRHNAPEAQAALAARYEIEDDTEVLENIHFSMR